MTCYVCQARVTREHRFCEQCGQPIPWARPSKAILERFDLEAFNRLREEKERLRQALEHIVTEAGEAGVPPVEQGAWGELYERWVQVRDEITAQMQAFVARTESDRRSGRDRRQPGRQAPGRRHGTDRRDPFRVKNPFRRRSPPGPAD